MTLGLYFSAVNTDDHGGPVLSVVDPYHFDLLFHFLPPISVPVHGLGLDFGYIYEF